MILVFCFILWLFVFILGVYTSFISDIHMIYVADIYTYHYGVKIFHDYSIPSKSSINTDINNTCTEKVNSRFIRFAGIYNLI